MTRQQALESLGLYNGATVEHIQDKYARKRAELEASMSGGALQAEIARLEKARSAALAEDAPPVAKSRRGLAGWIVLALVLGALGVYTALTFAAGAALDRSLAGKETEAAKAQAAAWAEAWSKHNPVGTALPDDVAAAAKQAGDAMAMADSLLPEDSERAEAGYRQAVEDYAMAFNLQLAHVRGEFDSGVVGVWRASLKGRFPFDLDAKDDAPLELVEKIFNPVSGDYWRHAAEFERLAAIEVDGMRAAPPPENYTGSRDYARRLRDALFEGHEKLHVSFAARLRTSIRYRALELTVGDQTVSSEQDTFTPMVWGGEPARMWFAPREGARSPSPEGGVWSLLRILSRFELVQQSDGLMIWHFEGENNTRRSKPTRPRDPLVIELQPHGKANPFDAALFSAFAPE